MDELGHEPGAPGHRAGFIDVMLAHATDGLCLVSRDGQVLDTTPAVERMVGLPHGALHGRSGLELLHPDDVEPAVERLALVSQTVPEDFRPYRFRHVDGHWVTVELVARENPHSVPEHPDGTIVLSVRDVSEHHETRVQLDRIRRRNEVVAAIAARFVDALDDELDTEITGAIADVARQVEADQALLYRLTPDATRMSRTHEWTREGYEDRVKMRAEIGVDAFPVWREQLLALGNIVVADTSTLDPAWVAEAEEIRSTGVSAICTVPLVREGFPVGLLALGNWDGPHHWADDDIDLARVATDIIGSGLARRDAYQASTTAASRFRALVENSSDALIVLNEDAVISDPPIGTQLFGYRPEELVGVSALELVHPDDLEFAITEMAKALEDPDYQATNAMRIRHADGHWIPIELVASSRFDDPTINGIVMNVRDHSERDRIAAALRVSEERMRNLLKNLPGAVFRCTPSSPFADEYVSERIEDLTGYRVEEYLGDPELYERLILEAHRERTTKELEDAIAARRPYVMEYPIRHRDGSIRWLSEHGQAIYDDEDEPRYLEGVIFDITERVQAVEENREAETRLTSLVANVPGAVFRCEIEPPYRDVFISEAVEDLTGLPVACFGRDLEYYDLIHEAHRDHVDHVIARAIEQRQSYLVEYQIIHADGSVRWVEERGEPQFGDDSAPRFIDGAMIDVTDRKLLEQRLAHDAAHDPLTGLPNRTRLVEHLETTLIDAERDRRLLAVLFVDLDRFKLVNDALGHVAGDELLVHFTRRLRSALREQDVAARPGGDEFVIVCSDLVDRADAEAVAGRVARVLGDPFTVQGRTVFVTASVGIAFAEPGMRADELLRSADAAAYRAKDRGRNRYEVFDDALRAATTAALETETDLHRALERHQLFLRYQPIVDLATGALLGTEALIRWQHPVRGLLTPDQFLPAAEASGLIVAIGQEMLDLAIGALQDVPDAVLPGIAFNLSPRELAQPDLVQHVATVVRDRGIDPARLTIEITENAVLDDLEQAIATLQGIRDIGVRLAIDDFGTGYSSLSYLRRLPVHTVKIDRSFTAELGVHASNTIVAGIIGLASGLGLDVVAEGVERPDQAETLLRLGCTRGQGYLYSPPVTLDELLRLGRRGLGAARDARH